MREPIEDIEAFKEELFVINDALSPSGGQGNKGYNLNKTFKTVREIEFLNIKIHNKIMAQEIIWLQIFC